MTWARRVRLPAAFAGLFVVYAATGTQHHAVNDVLSSSLAAWRIANTGAPWLDGVDYPQLVGRKDVWVELASNGHLVSFRSPGSILGGVPGYLLARPFHAEWSLVPGNLAAAALTTLALWLLFCALRPRVGGLVAGAAVAVLGLTTPVWSVSADGMWTHPVTILGLAGMTWACVRERWWLVGVFGGVALWGRLHTALIVAILGLALAWSRRNPWIAVKVGSVSAAFLGLACVWSHWLYGTWSPAGGYSVSAYTDRATGGGRDAWDTVVNHLGLWVAPDRGILVWTPLLVLLAPAVLRSWRTLPDWSRWLLVGGIAYALVQGQLNGFSGGSWFYGYRLMLEPLICAAPAYVLSLGEMGKWARRLLGPVIGLQFGAFLLGSVTNGAIGNEDHLWTQNAYVYAMEQLPILILWVVLTIAIGWLAARVVRDRLDSGKATDPEPAQV